MLVVHHSHATSDKAYYYGGTVATFKDAKKEIEGRLVTTDETNLKFLYGSKRCALTLNWAMVTAP